MLSLHRADFTVDIEPTTNGYIRELGLEDKIINTNVSLGTLELSLLISKKSKFKNIIERFDKAYEKLEQNGTIERILSKYAL